MSDYLWDKSGAPDPEIEELERLLAPLGWKQKPRRKWPIVAAAAMVLIGSSVGWYLFQQPVKSYRTNATSYAKLDLPETGEVEIEPNTVLNVVSLGANEQRLDLKRGIIHARIWAAPRKFFVNTPSAVAVDLGCAYTLEVNKDGVGLVKVTTGWVAFEKNGRQSLVPATALCRTHPGRGPGIPYFEDSSKALQVAVDEFDRTGNSRALETILSESRQKDGLTLWHLLQRVDAAERLKVAGRLATLVHVPEGASLDALWDALELGDRSLYLSR